METGKSNMHRRGFLKLAGVGLSSSFFFFSERLPANSLSTLKTSFDRVSPFLLKESENSLYSFLRGYSEQVSLLSRSVVAKICGTDSPVETWQIYTSSFPSLKATIQKIGVIPVSTPQAPSNKICFLLDNKLYWVENIPKDSIVQRLAFQIANRSLLTGHEPLVYDVGANSLYDPFGVTDLSSREVTLVMTGVPAEYLQKLCLFMQCSLDSSVFRMKASREFRQLESGIMAHTAVTDRENEGIVAAVLMFASYVCEIGHAPLVDTFVNIPSIVGAFSGKAMQSEAAFMESYEKVKSLNEDRSSILASLLIGRSRLLCRGYPDSNAEIRTYLAGLLNSKFTQFFDIRPHDLILRLTQNQDTIDKVVAQMT
jgi:hypothetical protein